MQTEKILRMVGSASLALACQYGMTTIHWWESLPSGLANILCAYFGWAFAFVFLISLGGKLLTRNGEPWRLTLTVLMTTMLVISVYIAPSVLRTIEILLFIGMIIRFVQWTIYEPGVRYEPT